LKRKKIDRLAASRSFYARISAAAGGELQGDLERAFEFVPREYFLGPGPWHAVSLPSGAYVQTPTDDPIHVYQNLVFALNREKRINNGEPSLHGQLLGALHPAHGDTVLHIGCGTGYYAAILAQLVGPSGKVIAYEIEPDLARRAADNLKPWETVEVRAASGTAGALPRCDAIYVNAGATHPAANWLDALNDGGRLVFPLSGSGANRFGVSLLVTRLPSRFSAKAVGYCGFIDCAGATDPEEGTSVTAAFRSGALWNARSLFRGDQPDQSAVLIGKGWWLSSSQAASDNPERT
jgi:protein-L-isoaspartate(D-aspartate) O-methyltransferase